MDDNLIFRLIIAAGFVTVIPFGLYHRLKAHTGEKLDRLQEGLVILVGLRLTGLARVIYLIMWVINPLWLSWAAMPLLLPVRWTGVAFGACAAGLLLWSMRTLGPNLTDTVVTREKHLLVTGGPFHWVRHPFYLAFFLAVIGDSLVTAEMVLAVSAGVLIGFIVVRSYKEEANLQGRFGEAYVAYRRRTGKLFPKLLRQANDESL